MPVTTAAISSRALAIPRPEDSISQRSSLSSGLLPFFLRQNFIGNSFQVRWRQHIFHEEVFVVNRLNITPPWPLLKSVSSPRVGRTYVKDEDGEE